MPKQANRKAVSDIKEEPLEEEKSDAIDKAVIIEEKSSDE